MDHKKVLGVARVKNDIYKLVVVNDGDDYADESTIFQKMLREWKKTFLL